MRQVEPVLESNRVSSHALAAGLNVRRYRGCLVRPERRKSCADRQSVVSRLSRNSVRRSSSGLGKVIESADRDYRPFGQCSHSAVLGAGHLAHGDERSTEGV